IWWEINSRKIRNDGFISAVRQDETNNPKGNRVKQVLLQIQKIKGRRGRGYATHFHLLVKCFFSFLYKKRAGYLFDNLLFFLIFGSAP
ncbi:hypothetical protein L1N85_24745, partial [Paenibacillus alkaliterrae]|uniref:hypothetical protein n=1 Tax=Paenibacillus alkaliterrae TaxID=320909 RepID=UPI001F2FA02D